MGGRPAAQPRGRHGRLEELLPAFDDPRVGIASGKLLRFDGRTLDSAGQMLARSRQPKDRGYGRSDRGQFDRDEEVFGADSDAFDVARATARRQIAFGFGEHLCLGASLARLEARVMFEELFARWPRFALAGEPEPLQSNLMNGLVRMPVALEP